jgi:Cof subfamily protein (haloacid dehalogenase superfamily)
MRIKLIATDIDGTLLDSQSRLSDENVRAIQAAVARGIEIVAVTGRRFASARAIFSSVACDLHLIVSNGALIKSRTGETHQRLLLPADTARRVLQATADYRSYACVVFDRPREDQLFFEKVDWDGPFHGPYLRKHREQVTEVVPLTACLNGEDPIQVMFLGECAVMRRTMELLKACPSASEHTMALTEYAHRNLSMLDVLRRGVTKGAALAAWARRRGISREEVMAIGDNWNDREMLEYAGLPIVMGNAVPELKSLGWTATLSNDENGVAEAIWEYALNGTSPRS